MERLKSVRVHPLLLPFTEAERSSLRKRAVRKHWNKDEVIFRKGDTCSGMYDILSGSVVAVLESESGKCRPMGTYGPGDLLGILATLDGGPRHFTAVAREATNAMLLDRRDFTAIVASRPELNVHIKRDLCNEIRKIYVHYEAAIFLDVPARLSRLILFLYQRHAIADEKLKPPSLRFSQREIAELLGFSREWVARELVKWRDAGIIELRRSRLVIRNKSALAQMASPKAQSQSTPKFSH